MDLAERSKQNPILKPDPANYWEAAGSFNGCVYFDGRTYHMVYRALSKPMDVAGVNIEVSSIGYAKSTDGVNFSDHRQLFGPENEWEKYGCEDPRLTRIDGEYYIFYTALSEYPFNADGIKVAVAVTKDFKTFKKHTVTPFNAKAMCLFPERIDGKLTALLTVHTDRPPARICLASFERAEDMWSIVFWLKWYSDLEARVLSVLRHSSDHVEVGAPPVKTKEGWLLVFSYIKNYFSPPAVFGIEAVLLDLKNPFLVRGRTTEPLLMPEADYELRGNVANIAFPSGAWLQKDQLSIYYGAADTTTCLATMPIEPLVKTMKANGAPTVRLRRSSFNPIISPLYNHPWESKATFNPAAWYDGKNIHLIYRAMGYDNTSVFGYASSRDGFSLSERLLDPVYVPKDVFEQKLVPNGNSGCEDPRITQIGDTLYMCYTAFDGRNPPRVALTTISTNDFVNRHWNWSKPKLISPPDKDDKDAALFPKKINNKYVFLHRLGLGIRIHFCDDLNFSEGKWLDGPHLMDPRDDSWDSVRIGIAAPPIETKEGWLLLYHGISHHVKYRLGAALLDLKDPTKVLVRTDEPILEPEMPYEQQGQVPQVVFPCGAVVKDGSLFVFYGAADSVVGSAHIKLEEILSRP